MTDERPVVCSTCDTCRSRKVKCSSGQPCDRCARDGRPCTYSVKKKAGRPRGSKRARLNTEEPPLISELLATLVSDKTDNMDFAEFLSGPMILGGDESQFSLSPGLESLGDDPEVLSDSTSGAVSTSVTTSSSSSAVDQRPVEYIDIDSDLQKAFIHDFVHNLNLPVPINIYALDPGPPRACALAIALASTLSVRLATGTLPPAVQMRAPAMLASLDDQINRLSAQLVATLTPSTSRLILLVSTYFHLREPVLATHYARIGASVTVAAGESLPLTSLLRRELDGLLSMYNLWMLGSFCVPVSQSALHRLPDPGQASSHVNHSDPFGSLYALAYGMRYCTSRALDGQHANSQRALQDQVIDLSQGCNDDETRRQLTEFSDALNSFSDAVLTERDGAFPNEPVTFENAHPDQYPQSDRTKSFLADSLWTITDLANKGIVHAILGRSDAALECAIAIWEKFAVHPAAPVLSVWYFEALHFVVCMFAKSGHRLHGEAVAAMACFVDTFGLARRVIQGPMYTIGAPEVSPPLDTAVPPSSVLI